MLRFHNSHYVIVLPIMSELATLTVGIDLSYRSSGIFFHSNILLHTIMSEYLRNGKGCDVVVVVVFHTKLARELETA